MSKQKKKKYLIFSVLLVLAVIVFIFLKSPFVNQSRFEAPRQNTQPVEFTIGKDFTLEAVIGDLHYYDFIKDEDVFKYALEHTKDNTLGKENAIKVGNNTIDREARYTISQSMTAWEIADILLNQGDYSSCDHGCPESNFNPELLPGGDLAPTIKQKYEWVKTYDDCVKSIGHDGGQLSSEQYAQKTGIRICTSPDGRYFVQGEEGWTDTPPYP
jgi:hypothetical protein